jgi:hypothetical protein
MEKDVRRNAKAPLGPVLGERHVRLARQDVGELVEHERGLVREDAGLLRPEPERRQVLVLSGGEVDDAVDSTAHADDAPV